MSSRPRRLAIWMWSAATVGMFGYGLAPARVAANFGVTSNLAHLIGFWALCGAGGAVLWPRRAVLLAVLMGVAGVALEVAQLWIPGRAFEWADMAGDTAGVALGWATARLWSNWRGRPRWFDPPAGVLPAPCAEAEE